jgi:tRNA (guanine-N7-)-methyltransferase
VKPKDLKYSFSDSDRSFCLEERIFFVPPEHSEVCKIPFLAFVDVFGNMNPVCVEYCSGNGDWIVERASQQKTINWIAVEKRFDRVRKIWSKMKNRRIENLFIIHGEAGAVTKKLLHDSSLEAVYINFPDPWPKRRHTKHRLLQLDFLNEIGRVLKAQKTITFVTDEVSYMRDALKLFLHCNWFPFLPTPYFTTILDSYGTSRFENLWREKGREIRYTIFVNTK